MDDLPIENLSEPTTVISLDWIMYVVLGVLAIIVIAVLFAWIKKAFTKPDMYGITREQVQRRWVEVRKMSEQGHMGAKLAIMEADSILDASLKSLMISGDTLGERLRAAEYRYPRIKEVWPAHKLRNLLAHELDYKPSTREAARALDDFERALKMMGVL